MKAIKATSLGNASIVEIPEPDLKPDDVLVRPYYIGNNPCDWLIIDFPPLWTKDQTIGCDYSGVVEKIGSNVNTTLNVGDRVCGAVAGGVGYDTSKGAFADLIPAYGDFCFAVPKNVSLEQAATLGVGLSTVAESFYIDFGFPFFEDEPKFGDGKAFFVYGGSTATGMLAVQFAKLSGFRVITTCSPKSNDLVKERGADEVYDYHDFDKCVEDIRASVGDDLQYAYCCIGGEEPAMICDKVLSSRGGTLVTIVGSTCPRENVSVIMSYGQAVMADPYKSDTYKADQGRTRRTPKQKEIGARMWKSALDLLDKGEILAPSVELRDGLEGALSGIDDLRKGRISGKKILSRLG